MKCLAPYALFLVLALGCQGSSPDRLVADIQQMGGSCAVDEQKPDKPVIQVNLGMSSADDRFLERLKVWPQLQGLFIWNTGITDAGLEHVRHFNQLQKLDVSGTAITDAGLQHLKGMASLREVNLRGTKVSAAAVTGLRAALPKAKVSR